MTDVIPMTEISLIMPCYNRAYDLSKALEAYDRQNVAEPFELIAIDDASSDATYEVLTSFRPARFNLRVERQEKNQGPAAARNRGIALASAPLILFVGDDITPDPDMVQAHVVAHRHYPAREAALLGRVVWPDDLPVNTLMAHIDGIGAEQFSYHYLKDGQEYDFRHLYTANISLKTEFLKSLDHWFDTDFQFAAFEDVELAYRLAQRGLRIIYSSVPLGKHYHYHNIWTFSTRQFRSGMMAWRLAEKHPRLAGIVMGRSWPLRPVQWELIARVRRSWLESSEALEKEAIHLLSAHEWVPYPLLDHMYLRALTYFYFKGLIYGAYGDTPRARRYTTVYANRMLGPVLEWYRQAQVEGG